VPLRGPALAGLALATLLILSRARWFIERVYEPYLGPLLSLGLSAVSGWLPFSLAEPVAAVVLAVVAVRLAMVLRWVAARDARRAAESVAALATLALTIAATFYLSWGLYYASAPLVDRLDWAQFAAADQGAEADAAELARLAGELVAATNGAYVDATGGEDLGRPTEPDRRAPLDEATESALERGYARLADQMRLGPAFARARGSAKPLLASPLMSRLGLAGIYFPWTAEANYNHAMPGYQVPHSAAHEKAHQRGITAEDEANFLGYLAAALSGHAYTRYSGLVFAQRQLLSELQSRDPETVTRLVAARHPGVQRDVEAAAAYWRRYEGPAREVQEEFNDRYLRLHGIDEGIQAYHESVRLIVIFSRIQGGLAVPVGD
jgi:hypothetical protein